MTISNGPDVQKAIDILQELLIYDIKNEERFTIEERVMIEDVCDMLEEVWLG